MARYGQYCPITRAMEVLGDRWSLLIIRDLLTGVSHFNDLSRGLPRLSRGLLSKRLVQLRRDGLVEHRDGGYHVTEAGEALRPLVFGLAEWGARFAFGEPRSDELDTNVLMWWIRGRIDGTAFGRPRVVIHVHFQDGRYRHYWLVVDPEDVSLCFTDPGFPLDITIETTRAVLYQVWEAHIEWAAAMRDGLIEVTGNRDLVRALPRALLLSPVAPYVRRARC